METNNTQVTFNKQLFIDLANEHGVNTSHIEMLSNMHHHEVVVNGRMLDMLVDLQDLCEQLEAMGDDEFRGFYIELPRPTPKQWGDCEKEIADGEYASEAEYLEDWEMYNPMQTRWYHMGIGRYEKYRWLKFTDRKNTYALIANSPLYMDHNDSETHSSRFEEELTKIFAYLKSLVKAIISNPDGFNKYVAEYLPYQQRDGRIARKEFNRIEPRFKIDVADRELAIEALEASINKEMPTPLQTMTVRQFCKYYRIAHETYEHHFDGMGWPRTKITIPDGTSTDMADVVYYNRAKFADLEKSYNLDSEEDFEKFATDHYGELGLSRLNILASNYNRPGWVILVSNSYSSHVDVAIDVATALYKAGAPLEITSAEKLLKILKEEDYVGLIPHTYHDYMNHHDEGTVYELPWEYEVVEAPEEYITIEQYNEIISLAEWEEIEKVKLKS